ncbi:protein NRT1/ PTR FAMILY 5.6-like isoform X1 [Punica granatum]|uniref:Protein NRT1/ PTR FAMILY 5.6-like isoform X1 n=2 Tax=Punica granatum TaxID=22663 RepID=A0A6P8BP13_PUNGR|nr:protein NRT1/ PTR FAMILY 5.6-like isoform X1 [Punica granatum]PKI46613.1 hypothetical protein CRG98_032955 [Punica granatum]
MEDGSGTKKREIEEGQHRESERDEEKWVYDSSVDYKGRIPLRASTGVWKASLFIITIEFSERLSYFGIATNLISYLTAEMHQDLETAAKNVNYWAGVTTMMPLLGGFLADAYVGRFNMVVFCSLIYLVGLSLLTMSNYIPRLGPCPDSPSCKSPSKTHEVLFFLALYCISLGTGGHKPCLESFGADQFDDDHPGERKKKMSYFNWWNFALCCGLFLGVTVIVYLQDHVSWGVADLVLAVTMAVTIVSFYCGKRFYRFRLPEGSPLTPLGQVLVAALRKRKLRCPSSVDDLFELTRAEKREQGRLLQHTNRLRFLDKAAIMDERDRRAPEGKRNHWRLGTVTRVEETKLVMSMIPIWLTSLMFGVCVAQSSTFFVKQGQYMNRKIGKSFQIPQASIYALAAVGMIISVTFYEKILNPALRRSTGKERGLAILQRIGIGMIFSVVAMAVAALVEMKRLRGVKEGIVPSVFWLAPQFLILGLGDGFTLVGLQEYFYDEVPDSMRSLGIAVYLSVIGGGSFLSNFLITIVNRMTREVGGKSWISRTPNTSRLDKFYWLLSAMTVLNLCIYVLVARNYTYKNVQRNDVSDYKDIEGVELVT